MRYLVVDTETTGLSPNDNRIVEVAAVELNGLTPTMKHYHKYYNPEMKMPKEAQAIHGLSDEFLKDFPVFADNAKELADFFKDATLIIHNAKFDMTFLNAELKRAGVPQLTNQVIDTLILARTRFPGRRATLDALCANYGISLEERKNNGHGALLDAQLLTRVYLKMVSECNGSDQIATANAQQQTTPFVTDFRIELSPQEQKEYNAFVLGLK